MGTCSLFTYCLLIDKTWMPELMLVLISIVLCVIYLFWSSWNHPTNVLIAPFCCFKNSGGCVNRKKRKTVGSAEPAVFLIRGESLQNCQSVNMRSLRALAPSCEGMMSLTPAYSLVSKKVRHSTGRQTVPEISAIT